MLLDALDADPARRLPSSADRTLPSARGPG
jgi:hypothetical protein